MAPTTGTIAFSACCIPQHTHTHPHTPTQILNEVIQSMHAEKEQLDREGDEPAVGDVKSPAAVAAATKKNEEEIGITA